MLYRVYRGQSLTGRHHRFPLMAQRHPIIHKAEPLIVSVEIGTKAMFPGDDQTRKIVEKDKDL